MPLEEKLLPPRLNDRMESFNQQRQMSKLLEEQNK
jgi:hypothetical protein